MYLVQTYHLYITYLILILLGIFRVILTFYQRTTAEAETREKAEREEQERIWLQRQKTEKLIRFLLHLELFLLFLLFSVNVIFFKELVSRVVQPTS